MRLQSAHPRSRASTLARASRRPARSPRSWLLVRASSLRVREPFVLLALQARRASEDVSPELKRRLRKDACLSRVRGSLCAPAKLPARAFATHRTLPNLSRMHSAGCLAIFRASFTEHLSLYCGKLRVVNRFCWLMPPAGICRATKAQVTKSENPSQARGVEKIY